MKAVSLAWVGLCLVVGLVVGASNDGDFVGSLPGFGELPFISYAGYINVDEKTDSNLFYWFFESQGGDTDDTPLIIWLNGGPGASSLFGLFYENGPFHLNNDTLELTLNPYSWNEKAHVMYWDQPVGTGFSYSNNAYQKNETGLSNQFVDALVGFYTLHPEYLDNDLIFTGESYCGKYIPWITTTITQHNNVSTNLQIPLTKIAIGDGWMDPVAQTAIQLNYGYWMGFIDTKQYSTLYRMYTNCTDLAAMGEWVAVNEECGKAENLMLTWAGQPNVYDVRVWGDYGGLNPGVYLNQTSVSFALHTNGHKWVTADNFGPVAAALVEDIYQSSVPLLAPLVERYPFMFYTGDFDMSCGFMGTENILSNLVWPHQAEWLEVDRELWMGNNGQTAGWVKSLGNLKQVTVAHAGHILPMNQPENAQTMIYNFIFDLPFDTPCTYGSCSSKTN